MTGVAGVLGLLTFTAAVGFLLVGGGRPGRRVLRHAVRRRAVKRVRAGVRPAVKAKPAPRPPRGVPTAPPRSGATITSTSGITHRVGTSSSTTACGVKVTRTGKAAGRKCRRCY